MVVSVETSKATCFLLIFHKCVWKGKYTGLVDKRLNMCFTTGYS